MTEFNEMQRLKRRFFSMRNGIVADTLRRSGLGYRMIFGLNLPQIADIAREIGPSAELARELWADTRTRESLLLAPMIMPREVLTEAEAREWFEAASTPEVADVLCHRLLRHLPWARGLAMEHVGSGVDMERYTAFRLLFNLLPAGAEEIMPLAKAEYEAACPLTRGLTHALIEEIEFLTE